MRELFAVAVLFLTLVGLAYGINFVGQAQIYELAWLSMIAIGLVAVGAEVVYFAGLLVSLRKSGPVPKRWYAPLSSITTDSLRASGGSCSPSSTSASSA